MAGLNYDTTFEKACPIVGTTRDVNAAPCAAFLNKERDNLVRDQLERKDNAMAFVRGSAQRVFDADKNSSIAVLRSADLQQAATSIKSINTGLTNNFQHDNEVSRRQFEINEYHYHNKLDTLFFLQILFIAVLIMAILMYFNRRGVLTPQMTGILTAILAIVLVVIGVSRYFYTERTRDRRLWHRRYFQTEDAPPAQTNKCAGPSPSISLSDVLGTSTVACAEETTAEVKKWFTAQEAEVKRQMAGTNAANWFGSATLGPSCKRK